MYLLLVYSNPEKNAALNYVEIVLEIKIINSQKKGRPLQVVLWIRIRSFWVTQIRILSPQNVPVIILYSSYSIV